MGRKPKKIKSVGSLMKDKSKAKKFKSEKVLRVREQHEPKLVITSLMGI